MKKIAVLLLVMLSLGVFAGTASAKARGMIVWGHLDPEIEGKGVKSWGMPIPANSSQVTAE